MIIDKYNETFKIVMILIKYRIYQYIRDPSDS